MRNKLHLDTAFVYKNYSTCARLKVGAVLINEKTGRIIGAGYNGTPSGTCNCNKLFKSTLIDNRTFKTLYSIDQKVFVDYMISFHHEDNDKFWLEDGIYYTHDYEAWKKYHGLFSTRYEIHSELNAIISSFKDGTRTPCEDMTLIVTTAPCYDCCKLICATGIKKVVYVDIYDRTNIYEVEKLLKNFGIELIHFSKWVKD